VLTKETKIDKSCDGIEILVLKISTVLTIIYGIVGVTIAVLCDSMTLMLDGLYGVADIVVSFLSIVVVRKIRLPPNERYHFGYAKYEPFMTAVDGILIAAICAATIFSSIQDMFHPEPMDNVHLAVIYSFISFFICTGFGIYMKRVGKRCHSTILPADAQLWIIEGIVSLGVFVAFGISEYVSRTYWKGYADYVDPVLCIILAVFLLAKPINIIRDSLYDLLDVSPYQNLKDEIIQAARACAEEHRLQGIKSVKLRKAGRKLFVIVHFLADKSLSLNHTEFVKQWMIERAIKTYPEVDITVLFSGR
jgi:cation diffusion facilitator family transporter